LNKFAGNPSSTEIQWLEWVMFDQKIKLRTAFTAGGQKKIGFKPVDGYDAETRTVYQFHGERLKANFCFTFSHRLKFLQVAISTGTIATTTPRATRRRGDESSTRLVNEPTF
jgi:hypothetical protein